MEWRSFLEQFSRELRESGEFLDMFDGEWFGYEGATEAQLQATEQRLGTTLPPSYRAFLQVSNGWRNFGHFIDELWSVENIEWLRVRNPGFATATAAFPVSDEAYFDYSENQDSTTIRSEYLPFMLQISGWGDAAVLMLNPQIVTAEGEWEAWFYASWLPGARRYRSFAELAAGERQSFQRVLRQNREEEARPPSEKLIRTLDQQIEALDRSVPGLLTGALKEGREALAKMTEDEATFPAKVQDYLENLKVDRPDSQELMNLLLTGQGNLADLAQRASTFTLAETLRNFTGQFQIPSIQAPQAAFWEMVAGYTDFPIVCHLFVQEWWRYSLLKLHMDKSPEAEALHEAVKTLQQLYQQHLQDEVALFEALQVYQQKLAGEQHAFATPLQHFLAVFEEVEEE